MGENEEVRRKALKNIEKKQKTEELGSNPNISQDLNRYYFLGTKNNQYDHIIIDAAKKFNIDPVELKSLLQKESGEKINKTTIGSNGEVGAAQFMYRTAKGFRLKVINIEPYVKARRSEEHRFRYLKEFLKEGTNWQDPNLITKIDKKLDQADRIASRYLKEDVKNRNKTTKEVLRNALKTGTAELRKAFMKEVEKSQKIISENSNPKLIEKLKTANDERLDIKKSILTAARYLSGFLNNYGTYEKAEVLYKIGSFRGDQEWIKKDTTTVKDILSSKHYKDRPTLKKEVLGKNGRLERLGKYREANRLYKLDRYVLLARGEKGNGSLEKPYQLAVVKDKKGDEKYCSISSGKLYNSLDSVSKEFKWKNKKEKLIQGEGKTLDEAKAKLQESWKKEGSQKTQERPEMRQRELPHIREMEGQSKQREIEKKQEIKRPRIY